MSITKHWHDVLQATALIKPVKFGADWTLHAEVSIKQGISCCQQVALYI